MSLECPKCHEIYEVGQWPWCPHGWVVKQNAQGFEPVVYHENAQGEIRFPGDVQAPVPAGFERKELKTTAEVRAFQTRVGQIENAKIRDAVEQECAWLESIESANRPELYQRMASMSPAARAFAERAIAQHNARRPKSGDAGFYVEAFEMDATNREAYRDAKTRWERRRR